MKENFVRCRGDSTWPSTRFVSHPFDDQEKTSSDFGGDFLATRLLMIPWDERTPVGFSSGVGGILCENGFVWTKNKGHFFAEVIFTVGEPADPRMT